MNDLPILRKSIVTKIVNKLEYTIEDVLNKEELIMIVPDKFRINYFKIELGIEVYITVSSPDEKVGKIVSSATFKVDNNLHSQKIMLDEKHKTLFLKKILTIARIKEKLNPHEFLVEDILSDDLIHIKMSGKQRLNHRNLEIGEDIYVQRSPYDLQRGRLITGTNLKMDESGKLSQAKYELDKRRK